MSEFGKGLCYCLVLFLAHAERYKYEREIYKKAGLSTNYTAQTWFNAASDHLCDFQWHKAPTVKLRIRCKEFSKKCLNWGHGFGLLSAQTPTEEDVSWAIQEAKDLLRLIDNAHKIKTEVGHE
jgi:hypothetical protein